MSSLAKIRANRENAAKSTGPATPRGKAQSASNSITHGITARTLHLRNESPDELLAHIRSYIDRFHPADQAEMDLVAVLISASWRLRRIWRTETALLDAQMSDDRESLDAKYQTVDPDTRTALAFKSLSDQSSSWHSLDRYEARLRRSFRSALTDLLRLRGLHPAAQNFCTNEPNKSCDVNTGRSRDAA